jgi:hypothetical protein
VWSAKTNSTNCTHLGASQASERALFNLPLSRRVGLKISSVEDGATEGFDEPKLGVVLGDALELADLVGLCSSLANSITGSSEDDDEVHSENTCRGVVLNSEINMLIDTKSEVT